MKKAYIKFKLLAGAVLIALFAVSCMPETQTMGDAGQTLVKLLPDGFNLIALDAVATSQSAIMFAIRRDVHSEAALNSATTVVLAKDDAILTAYNTDNGTSFIPLPVSLGNSNPAPGGDSKITVNFGPGEASKEIIITIPDATQFNFSEMYGLAYKIESITGTGILSTNVDDEIVVQVLVKNAYDGVYTVTANSPMLDVANSSLTGYYPFTYELETSGAHACTCLDTEVWGDYFHPILSGTNISGYGSFGLEVFFDPSGNGSLIDMKNVWGNPPSNTRMPALDPSGVNKRDPATGDIQIKYFMLQPSVITTPPHIRVYFDETWTYKGPR